MKYRSILLMAFFNFSSSLLAHEKMIGVLTLPELFGPEGYINEPFCDDYISTNIPLYKNNNTQIPVASLRSVPYQATLEYEYQGVSLCENMVAQVFDEQSQQLKVLETTEMAPDYTVLIVLERKNDWYRIQLTIDGDSAWTHNEHTDRYHSVEDWISESGGELLGDVAILDKPNGSVILDYTQRSDDIYIFVTEHIKVDDELWFKVKVYPENEDLKANDNKDLILDVEGWIPAYDKNGDLTLYTGGWGC